MAQDRERLKASLTELETQLASLENVDPAVQQRLRRTIADIEAMLDEPASAEPQEATFAERLSEGVNHFEATHPNLSGMIGSVIDALGRMGI